MELSDVVRRRRMVRNYSSAPVDPAVLRRVLEAGHRAPTAGNTAGRSFLLLDSPETVGRYWRATAGDRLASPDRWLRGMVTAPVLVVPLSSRDAYEQRYAEPDKHRSAAPGVRAAIPWWHTDAAMAVMSMLLTAVDEGLGACFFGLPEGALGRFRDEFGVPGSHEPVGVVSLGHRADDDGSPGSAGRGRPPLEAVVHRGGWQGPTTTG